MNVEDVERIPTGYIGGAVLQRILEHPQASTFDITALVRDASKAQTLQSNFGVKSVIGSLQDHKKLTELAEAAHVVVQTVSPYMESRSGEYETTYRQTQMTRRL